jgi:hypothetical protein
MSRWYQQAFSGGGAEGTPVRRWEDTPPAMPQTANDRVSTAGKYRNVYGSRGTGGYS